jgi:hypothetical protein
MLEGTLLKGYTPKATRRYATRGFQEISDNQEARRPSFRIGGGLRGRPHCFEAPPDSINVITTLRQIMTVCREFWIREDRFA